MISEVIASAFVGGVAGSAITAITQIYITKQRQTAETERRHAEFYAESKVDSLTELHSALDDCYRTFDEYYKRNVESVDREDYLGEIVPALDQVRQSLSQASIFLDDSETETMHTAVTELEMGVSYLERKAISDRVNSDEIDRDRINDSFDDAKEVLRKQMYGPIEKLEAKSGNEVNSPQLIVKRVKNALSTISG